MEAEECGYGGCCLGYVSKGKAGLRASGLSVKRSSRTPAAHEQLAYSYSALQYTQPAKDCSEQWWTFAFTSDFANNCKGENDLTGIEYFYSPGRASSAVPRRVTGMTHEICFPKAEGSPGASLSRKASPHAAPEANFCEVAVPVGAS